MHKFHGNSEMSQSSFKHLNQYFFCSVTSPRLICCQENFARIGKKYFNSLTWLRFLWLKRLKFAFQDSARMILLMWFYIHKVYSKKFRNIKQQTGKFLRTFSHKISSQLRHLIFRNFRSATASAPSSATTASTARIQPTIFHGLVLLDLSQ